MKYSNLSETHHMHACLHTDYYELYSFAISSIAINQHAENHAVIVN